MVDRVDVATNTALVLTNAMVNQETGVRGFVLGGNDAVPRPLPRGRRRCASRARRSSTRWRAARMRGSLDRDLAAARRAIDAWQTGYAQPTMERIHRLGAGQIEDAAVAARQGALRRRARRARAPARRPAGRARRCARGPRERGAHRSPAPWCSRPAAAGRWCSAIAVIGRQVIARADRAAGDAGARRRRRASCSARSSPSGPSDIERLGRDVESMRARIVRELEAVRAAEAEIQAKAARARALQRRARAVRLRRLARPPGAAAQGHELLPDARAPLLRDSSTSAASSTSPSPSTAPSACRR